MSTSVVNSKGPDRPAHKKRRIWRIVLFGLLLVLIGIAAVATYVWSERYALIENGMREAAAAQGLDLDLSIEQMSRTEARISNIVISDESGEILRARRLDARYQWRDALEGRFDQLRLTGPEVTLTLDEKGRPIADWMPAPDPNNQDSALMDIPPEGIFVTEATFDLTTPYGAVNGTGDATVRTEDDFEVAVKLEPSKLSWGEISGTLSGPIQFERDKGQDAFVINTPIKNWSYRDMAGEVLDISGHGDLELSPQAIGFDGDFTLKAQAGNFGVITAKVITARYTGKARLPRSENARITLSGNWSADSEELAMPDAAARRRLAEGLTLKQTLSQTPVAEHFAAGISSGIDRLLEKGNLTGQGRVLKTQVQTDVFATKPIQWRSERGSVELTPPDDERIYAFDRLAESLNLRFDANFTYPKNLEMRGVELSLSSLTGRDFQAVKSFRSQIKSDRIWRETTPDGNPVRLAPFSVKADYTNTEKRQIRLSGGVDYDGDIPGGYAAGMKADGTLFVDFTPNMQVRFASVGKRPIRMDRFDTVTDWFADNVSFVLPPGRPFFTRTGHRRGRLNAQLSDIQTGLSRLDGSQSMILDIERSAIEAIITPNRQDWVLKNGPVYMTSDNIPSPGTVMTSAESILEATLVPDQPVEFSLNSPQADIRTQLVTALGLKVQGSGTPDRINVNYQDGEVTFLAVELPTVPMTGDVVYENGVWAGDAVTTLPRTGNTPIDVSYRFEDGVGTARVDIVDLVFRVNKLQPQELIPTLRGKIADVFGPVSAQIDLTFGADQPLTSKGRAQLQGLSFGTLPGPVSGVFADLGFSSFFPPETDGVQTLTLSKFDPGFPLEDGVVEFKLIPNGIEIVSAKWPIGNGFFSLDPATWDYLAEENRMTLRIENVSLGEFFDRFGNENLKATGNVNGVLPIVISGVNVNVDGGQLLVEDGGVIQYVSEQTDAAAALNPQAEMAFEALKDFQYEELELLMDGPLDGEITLRAMFLGSNPNVLYGSQFKFNVTMTGELLNIARSFRIGPEILDRLKDDLVPQDIEN